jgi:hypothetical protein
MTTINETCDTRGVKNAIKKNRTMSTSKVKRISQLFSRENCPDLLRKKRMRKEFFKVREIFKENLQFLRTKKMFKKKIAKCHTILKFATNLSFLKKISLWHLLNQN